MITISIEPADNGLIKFLIDDNINGGGEEHVSRKVYEFDGARGRSNQVNFLRELLLDLGLDTGTDLDPNKLNIQLDWGSQYEPTQDELKIRIKQVEAQLRKLNALIEE